MAMQLTSSILKTKNKKKLGELAIKLGEASGKYLGLDTQFKVAQISQNDFLNQINHLVSKNGKTGDRDNKDILIQLILKMAEQSTVSLELDEEEEEEKGFN